MAATIPPDTQANLPSLQDYMLDKWGEAAWLKADSGVFNGTPVQELASMGILDYQNIYTSHHKLVSRLIGNDTYVYLMAEHRQDYPTILAKRLLSR